MYEMSSALILFKTSSRLASSTASAPCSHARHQLPSPPRAPRRRTFFATSLYLSARSRFQHPPRYSNAVSFSGSDATTVIISGSSVMLAGERESRASRRRSHHSELSFRGDGRAASGGQLVLQEL